MERIVQMPDKTWLRLVGKVVEGSWVVRDWRANGVLERSARPLIAWEEDGVCDAPMTNEERAAYYVHNFKGKERAARLAELNEEIEEKRQRSLASAARRAKTKCRRVIITEGFDELLTLTYRANQTDRALCKQHFNVWFKRMKRALGTFRFCASFEKQERGAMHVHVATHKLPQHAKYKGVKVKAWEVGTRIWRDIVGADNGMCFVGGRTKWGGHRRNMGLAKMAAYVSKYIMKDFEDAPAESNRYSRSNGTVIAKAETLTLSRTTLADLIAVTFEQGSGDVVIAHRVSPWRDGMWLCTEAGKPPA